MSESQTLLVGFIAEVTILVGLPAGRGRARPEAEALADRCPPQPERSLAMKISVAGSQQ